MPLLSVNNLDVSYGAIRALHGVSLHVERGEILTLIGANGAGKTTLLRAISGLLRPSRGSIQWDQAAAARTAPQPPGSAPAGADGADESEVSPGRARGAPVLSYEAASVPTGLATMAPHEIVRLGISHVPEGRHVFARMTVEENLHLGAYHRRDRGAIPADVDRCYGLFPRLAERRRQKAGTLSGGEQQMLAIGRALMARPRLLLLDEPSLGLAPKVVQTIFQIVREINAQGMTVFLVEQNAHMALSVAHRGYVLQTGAVIKSDQAARLLEDPEVKKAYLGG